MSSTTTSGNTTVTTTVVQFIGPTVTVADAAGSLGFYGATPVAVQTVAAAGSDAATTQALANSIRTILLNLGLVV